MPRWVICLWIFVKNLTASCSFKHASAVGSSRRTHDHDHVCIKPMSADRIGCGGFEESVIRREMCFDLTAALLTTERLRAGHKKGEQKDVTAHTRLRG